MVILMQTMHREGRIRHQALNQVRFYYEKSPHYEMGYLMGEIIERYRKMVNHARRRHTWRSTHVHWLVKRIQTIQHLYFEIVHLCGMMHEIQLKYRSVMEFADMTSKVPYYKMQEMQHKIRQELKKKELERQKAQKKILKNRIKAAKKEGYWEKFVLPPKKKGPWPHDYGWDIGEFFW
ncbi:uncharacterized protein LOC132903195 [Amyelois transitella]|uniref:uncharacterized protein LOC132903195 n=1 Tax=Amyelois transitella TaxID=680683 RepID=UPI002990181A|nr:uncharacterized protein LOC132903195 [Amyelois transitella]